MLKNSGRVAIGIGDPKAMNHRSFTAHGFRLRPLDEITAALAATGLPVIEHLRVGDGPTPAHVLVAKPD